MRPILLLINCLILLSGCNCRWCAKNCPPQVKDSIYEKIVYVPVTIPVKGDSSKDTVSFYPCNTIDTTIHVVAKDDSLSKLIIDYKPGQLLIDQTIKDRNIKTFEKYVEKFQYKAVAVPFRVTEYKVYPWCWWSLGINILVILIVVLRFIVRKP